MQSLELSVTGRVPTSEVRTVALFLRLPMKLVLVTSLA